jgi:hypothetical protein
MKRRVRKSIDLSKKLKQIKDDSLKKEILETVGKAIVNEMQAKMDVAKSPVDGGRWKSVRKDGSVSVLFDEGDLRDAIDFKIKGDRVEIGVYDSSEVPKAFAHNEAYKGHPHIKQNEYYREFIPEKNQNFIPEIESRIDNIIEIALREQANDKSDEFLKLTVDESSRVIADQIVKETESRKQSILDILFRDDDGFFR